MSKPHPRVGMKMNKLRILSLLPAATEIAYLLGLQKYLVGVSHECDYPPQVKLKPRVTSSPISNEMDSGEIDRLVGHLVHQGLGVFHIKKNKLKLLKPNLIITQELCKVCAIPFTQVQRAARILDGEVKIVSLEPESVEDILENIRVVGEFGGREKEADRVIGQLRERLENIQTRLPRFTRNDVRPKVLVIEWLDPIMIAGHWVPEMVEKAGGRMLITKTGEKSKPISLDQIKTLHPELLIISPCGFDIQRTFQELSLIRRVIREIGDLRGGAYLVDGNSYMTRPGPRIVDGIKILSEIIHPDVGPRKYSKRDWIELK